MDQHIYPGEFIVLMAFMLAPALIVASAGQVWFLLRRNASVSLVVMSLLPTAVATIVVTTFLFLFAHRWLPRALGLQDLVLGSAWFPILPLAFVIAALSSTAGSLWFARRMSGPKHK